MHIKAVLFDMFDTLMLIERDHAFHSPSIHAVHEFLLANGILAGFEEFEKAYEEARDELYAKAETKLEEPHFNVRIAAALKRLGYNCAASDGMVVGATDVFCRRFMEFVHLDENAKSALASLHEEYELGIVSNFAIPECVTKLLSKYGLSEFFSVVIVSGAVNRRKPSPEIFQEALRKLGFSAGETVFVGDTFDADVQGAKVVGMKTVYLERRVQRDSETVCPDQTIKSLKQLPKAIECIQNA